MNSDHVGNPKGAPRRLVAPEQPNLASVCLEIAPDDEMWDTPVQYAHVGRSAIECIDRALKYCRRDIKSIENILDIPCGHGRVARFLRQQYPSAHLTVADVNISGVRFCRAHFADDATISDRELGRLAFGRQFDLIWVGSLITHFAEKRTRKLLKVLGRNLKPDGVLVVTSHGQFAASQFRTINYLNSADKHTAVLQQYLTKGYGYADYDYQTNYGISLIKKSWFKDQFHHKYLRFETVFETAWADHHDVVVFRRNPWWRSILTRPGRSLPS